MVDSQHCVSFRHTSRWLVIYIQVSGVPRWLSDKEPTCQCGRHRRHGFDPWVGKIPWKNEWQPPPIFWPWEFHGQRCYSGLQSMGSKRLGHGWACMQIHVSIIFLEKEMATHSSTLAWKIPWPEEPGRLQSMGSWRVGHDWATSLSLFIFMHWRRKWQPTPVFLPGESQGQQSLVGCRLWGCIELDTTEST